MLSVNPAIAANFNDNLREIRAEINRDNLEEAIKLIKKIEISNENQQEKIDLLFGDIYLKINPGHLITDHMFARSRNTNYLGELCIYLGFTLLAKDYLPLIGLSTIIIFVWIPNMIKKDKSLSRYSEFSDYKKKSKSFFPFLF